MSFPSQCPICKTLLGFPEAPAAGPLRCPVCNSRFSLSGRRLAHLAFTDFYKLLEIEPDASEEGIRKAVRAKILEHHPDRNPDDPRAPERLREVIRARELLTDPYKRRSYDSVYRARTLPLWSDAARRERYRYTEPRPSAEAAGARARPAGVPEAPRAERPQYEDIGHLIDEIDVVLMQAGVPIGVSRRRRMRYSRVRLVWQIAGMLTLGLAGLLFGLLNGRPAGAAIMAFLGGIFGWMLTSYPGGLVVLAYFVARMFIFSFILAMVSARIATGIWIPEGFGEVLNVFNVASVTGAVALGLWWIGMSALHGRAPYMVHHMALRQAALGAWLGSLWGCFILVALRASEEQLNTTVGLWLLFFTAYLLLDTSVFGRTWILVNDRT